MEEMIFDLIAGAKELLANAGEIDETLNEIGQETKLTIEQFAKIEKHLDIICETLTKVVNVLRNPTGPLGQLIQQLDGVKVSSDATDALARFLNSHKEMLEKIGVPGNAVNALLQELSLGIENGLVRLDDPQTITSGDDDTFLVALEELRDTICDIRKNAQLLNEAWDPKLLVACVKGVMGTCSIVIDISGVLTLPAVTLFGLYTAVKSTWLGYRMVVNSVETIKGLWTRVKNSANLNRRQRNLRRHERGTDPFGK